jgi:GNAT superfamily N-acetyltransferase
VYATYGSGPSQTRPSPSRRGGTKRRICRNRSGALAWNEVAATFLAVGGNDTVGLVTGFVVPEDRTRTELVSMWVTPEARGRGVGRQLVAAGRRVGTPSRCQHGRIVGDGDERSGSAAVRIVSVHLLR